MDDRYGRIQPGWSAMSSDGEKIGEVEDVGRSYVLVTKGLIFTTDLYIPTASITDVDDGEARFVVDAAKSDIDAMGWTEPPTADTATAPAGAPVEGLGYTGRDDAADLSGTVRREPVEVDDSAALTGAAAATSSSRVDQDDWSSAGTGSARPDDVATDADSADVDLRRP